MEAYQAFKESVQSLLEVHKIENINQFISENEIKNLPNQVLALWREIMSGLEHLFTYPEESTFITHNRTANASNFLFYLESAILTLEDLNITDLILNLEKAKWQLKYLLPRTSPEGNFHLNNIFFNFYR